MRFQERLLTELSQRQAKNPAYSMRAFAAQLGLSPTLLSQLLSGARPLTHRTANLMATRLGLDPAAASQLMAQVSSGKPRMAAPKAPADTTALSVEEFRLLADWEHFAVLALAGVAKNQIKPEWIAHRLGITAHRAAEVFARLEKLGYVQKCGAGFRQTTAPLRTTQDIPSAAIKQYHAQNLEKAKASLYEHIVEERYFGSATFALDPAEVPHFKTFLRRTREKAQKRAGRGRPNRAYHLSLQLFPIDSGETDHETLH